MRGEMVAVGRGEGLDAPIGAARALQVELLKGSGE